MEVLYNNLFIHFVFTTKDRQTIIEEKHRDRIEKYITGIVNNHGCRLYSIYANPDHIHFLVSRDPALSEKALADLIANASEIFINMNNLCKRKFNWQPSCSAFSVSKKDVDRVCQYIKNQPNHHKKQSFTEEYDRFLKFYQQTISLKK